MTSFTTPRLTYRSVWTAGKRERYRYEQRHTTMDYDLKITGGTIYDGTGAPGRVGDVGIKDGKIAAVGEAKGKAAETVEAKGKVVAPGFVDIHTHYDAQVLWDRDLTPSSAHGVTTVVLGNCGVGVAPVGTTTAARRRVVQALGNVEGMSSDVLEAGIEWTFTHLADYLAGLGSEPTRL